MMVTLTKRMLSKSFSKVKFKFTHLDWDELNSFDFGLYIHVPFCRMFCSFCPFYKVRYDEKLKKKYIQGLKKEIRMSRIEGKASWLYIGGGTPNLLTAGEISEILAYVKEFVALGEVGMEGNPTRFTPEYLEEISNSGIHKISIGIESFQPATLKAVNRAGVTEEFIRKIVDHAQSLGISVNIDLMVGLPKQNTQGCLRDAETIANIKPNQVTIYPFLVIPGVKAEPSMSSQQMFETIEGAWNILKHHGYKRNSIWVFSKNGRIYDSAKDELVSDYLGFGPAAFSTCGNVQVVNPPIELYLRMLKQDKRLAFRSELDKKATVWRQFSHELYKLRIDPTIIKKMPFSVKLVLHLLRATGNVQGLRVTDKGRYFVHEITKTVVESLPFPLSNPKTIENRTEYEEVLKTSQKKEPIAREERAPRVVV
ncbi:MAG: radical SAM protein [Candidatus Bathyarchaeota archaeon]|nr:radical SAM protein [Candidatus Bathyarchaeota archaeon]